MAADPCESMGKDKNNTPVVNGRRMYKKKITTKAKRKQRNANGDNMWQQSANWHITSPKHKY